LYLDLDEALAWARAVDVRQTNKFEAGEKH
jgi:hypothetical protein